MGLSCSKCAVVVFAGESSGNGNGGNGTTGGASKPGGRGERKGVLTTSKKFKKAQECHRQDSPDPVVFDLTRRSVAYSQQRETTNAATTSTSTGTVPTELDTVPIPVPAAAAAAAQVYPGQHHLLYKQLKGNNNTHAAAGGATAASGSSNSNKYKNKKSTVAGRDAAATIGTPAKPTPTATGTTESRTTVPAVTFAAPTAAPPKKSNTKTSKLKGTGGSSTIPGRQTDTPFPTRVVVRRHSPRHYEEGMSGTHIYCIRYPKNIPLDSKGRELPAAQEQCPNSNNSSSSGTNATTTMATTATIVSPNNTVPTAASSSNQDPSTATAATPTTTKASINKPSTTSTTTSVPTLGVDDSVKGADNASNSTSGSNVKPATATAQGETTSGELNVDQLFRPSAMSLEPTQSVVDWVTISEEHSIYVADVGLGVTACDEIVAVTEQVCRGQYAAYTYAKQTLGCREFPMLAATCQAAAHTVTHAIVEFSDNADLALDDREPHMVKYDVTKKERQKLDMHTDKSEWTFLIALSNGCGMDYEGGGTYFECLDATLHLQRGHALIFPGKLRHCGQRITAGLRFLLVGFLVDKTGKHISFSNDDSNAPDSGITAHLSSYH